MEWVSDCVREQRGWQRRVHETCLQNLVWGRPHRHGTCRLSRPGCVRARACAESFPRHSLWILVGFRTRRMRVKEGLGCCQSLARFRIWVGTLGVWGELRKAGEVAYSFIKQAADCRTQS